MSNVDHPDHYGGEDNPYEVIKVLRAWDLEGARGFCWGNVIKYTQRAKAKGGVEDRMKAEWYATELVSIEAQLAGQKMTKPDSRPMVTTFRAAPDTTIVIDWEKGTYAIEGLYSSSGRKWNIP